ncbi:STAS domain-containing protein [Actinomadura sp. 21ATH]|uniref:STAS domain-containing protein n=1 Tax=Actinomadura sp. 21ATH TaxID=1735444 RepID=UPI0035C0D231
MSVGRAGGTVTVRVVGEVDVATADPLLDCVGRVLAGIGDRCRAERVVVQMGGVSFIDASGLGALVALRNAARREGVPLLLAGMSAGMWRLLELTELTWLAEAGDG